MIMKKCVLVLLVLACVCISSFSCSKDKTEQNNTEELGSSDLSSDYITIAENKTINYQLVYPYDANDSVMVAVSDVFKIIEKYSDSTPTMHDDYISTNQEHNTESLEILIGKTNYPETREVLEDIGFGDWKICKVGNKLVIAAYSERALQNAVTKFISELKKGSTEDGVICISSDIEFSGILYETANNLPEYVSEILPEIVDCGDNTVLALYRGTTLAEYDKYLAKLEALGYTYHTSNKMADNYFATYYNDRYLIHAGFYGYENSVRMTIEPKNALVPLINENTYTKNSNVVTSMAQIGLYHEASDYHSIGMAYVFQLADGSFLVIDGGYPSDAPRLYSYMKSKAPDGNIVIASWFVTHNDPDHRGCITNFATNYKNNVRVEQVVLNFPSSEAYFDCNQEPNSAAQIAIKGIPDCKVIKAHTGQKFYIRNAVVELLYTLDSYYPEKFTNFNNSSLVFTVDIEGERMFFAGDISEEVTEILVDTFKNTDYVRSDFLQLAHHGIRNSHGTNMPNTVELYKMIRPSVVLWPTSNANYLNTNRSESHQIHLHAWNAEAVDVAREVYIAGEDYVTVFKLPYSMFSARRELITIVE